MQKRFLFAVIAVVLLLAGTWASIACEMVCLPHAQAGACCPRQMQHAAGQCEHAGGSSLMAMHDCHHPQNHESAALADAPAAMQIFTAYAPAVSLPLNSLQMGQFDSHLSVPFLNRPPSLPLRI